VCIVIYVSGDICAKVLIKIEYVLIADGPLLLHEVLNLKLRFGSVKLCIDAGCSSDIDWLASAGSG
jgi:hypothetical protein